MLDRETILEILQTEPDPQVACDRLVEEANRAGGDDNITVVLLDVVGDDEASADGSESAAVQRPMSPAISDEPEPSGDATLIGSVPDRPEPMPARPKRRVDRTRAAIWSGLTLAIIVAALIGTRFYLDRQWYVGDDDGRVAIYNGIPVTVLGFKLSHIQESTELSTPDAQRLAYWRGLKDGITTGSFEQAQSIVDRIRQDLQTPPTPQPGGS
jgi:protein phosphatase